MQTLCFDPVVLSGLKKNYENNFKKGRSAYSPLCAYTDEKFSSELEQRGVIDQLTVLQAYRGILDPQKLGLSPYDEKDEQKRKEHVFTLDALLDFKNKTEASLGLLRCVEGFHGLEQILVDQVLPMTLLKPSPARKSGAGFSSHLFLGGIFVDPCLGNEDDCFEYCLSICHEMGHQALMYFQWHDKIMLEDQMRPIYSVIRKTERPAILSFHALMANTYMLSFVKAFRLTAGFKNNTPLYLQKLQQLSEAQIVGIKQFASFRFTEAGAQLFQSMIAVLNEL